MTKCRNVAVIVGSLRKASFSRVAALALAKLAPEGMMLSIVEMGALPLYDQDLDDEKRPPAEWTAFREALRGRDAVLFVTPEYNRSVPGVLKNAIDVGSRPYGQSVWSGKPAAIMSTSPGAMGAFGANHHLRQSLVFLNMPILQQPEAYVGNIGKLFGPEGDILEDGTKTFFKTFVDAFAALIERAAP